jgi:hypothetical protein
VSEYLSAYAAVAARSRSGAKPRRRIIFFMGIDPQVWA